MSASNVTEVDAGPKQVARRVVVNAPAWEVFALIADPHRHPELDGSGTVRDTDVKGPQRLSVGDTFTVGMTQYGVPYKITSKVTALEEDRLLEWQHPLGHRWRWELAESGPSSTQVTETFDYSTAKAPFLIHLLGYKKKNGAGIASTLHHLAERFGEVR